MAPVAVRLASAQRYADGRRIIATDIERHLGTRYTFDTLAALKRRFPAARFVWLMGADSLRDLPHWRGWQRIRVWFPLRCSLDLPTIIPPCRAAPRTGSDHGDFGPARQPASPVPSPPAWIYLTGRETSISATALRAAGATIETPKPGQPTGRTTGEGERS